MADQPEVKIVRIRDAPQLSAVGGLQQFRAVDYMVGSHGPFTVMVPRAEFTAVKVKQLVDAEAREIVASLA